MLFAALQVKKALFFYDFLSFKRSFYHVSNRALDINGKQNFQAMMIRGAEAM